MKKKKFEFNSKKEKPVLKKSARPVVYRDSRVDKAIPLIVDLLVRLLGSAGMIRYRKDFIDEMKEIMDGKSKK